MNRRTWPYGTVKTATVKAVEVSGPIQAVLLKADDDPPDECHIIIENRPIAGPDLAEGDRGRMTFLQGGPGDGRVGTAKPRCKALPRWIWRCGVCSERM